MWSTECVKRSLSLKREKKMYLDLDVLRIRDKPIIEEIQMILNLKKYH